MLNLIMTHSPRLAAMANNKRFGEDVIRDHAVLHRIALRTKDSATSTPTASAAAAETLRERTA